MSPSTATASPASPATPPGHYAVACPSCQQAFLVPEGAQGQGVQCPWCQAVMLIPPPTTPIIPSENRFTTPSPEPASRLSTPPPAPAQHIPSSGPPAVAQPSRPNSPSVSEKPKPEGFAPLKPTLTQGKAATFSKRKVYSLLFGAGVLSLGVLWKMSQSIVAQPSVIAPPATKAPVDQALEEAWKPAERFLTANSWAEALPICRHSDRLPPLMAEYHKQWPWIRFSPFERKTSRWIEQEGLKFAEFACTFQSRPLTLFVESTPQGYRVDWEQFADLAKVEWNRFYSLKPPGVSQRLRVTAMKGSVTDAYILAANQEPQKTTVVRLYGREPGDTMMALLPKGSPTEIQLAQDNPLSWSVGYPWILELEMADPNAVPPRVTIHAIAQKGWIIK